MVAMIKTCVAVAVMCLLSVPLGADEEKPTRAEKRLAKLQEDYAPTGETRNCVSLNRLRDSTIIDDQTIYFKAPGKTVYVNRLPNKCPRLAAEERFSYSVSIGQLCKLELITVIDSFGHNWSRCGLGEFEVWKKKTADSEAEQ